MDIRKELGVNSIKEKVREMRLHWYGRMQRMEENNERIVDKIVAGKRPSGRWMEGTCMNCGSPQRMPRTEHSRNKEFGLLTPPIVGKGEEEDP